MNVLREWLDNATAWEIAKLCESAPTTLATLRQHAGAYRHGHLEMSPELAGKIVPAAKKLHRPGLPELRRIDLSSTCHACECAQACEQHEADGEEETHG